MKETTYRDAIKEAMREEMRRDSNVFVYGIGVTDHIGIFGTTTGLMEEFGPKRCFDVPISEDALMGFGYGAAMNGLRPINIHIRMDFLMLTINQLSNMISSSTYGSKENLKTPLVVRGIIGRGWGQSFQHSKSMHAMFAHIPGLKVYLPSTPSDAKNMLISAIRDDNPVILIEHRWLYDAIGKIDEYTDTFDPEIPRIVHQGTDLTLACTSWMTVEALQAAKVLKKNGVSVEIINIASILPFHEQVVISSVNKTKNLIIADNDWLHCGFSAEVAARVYNSCYKILHSPIERIGFEFTPCPCTRVLENEFYGGAGKIIRTIERMLDISPIDISEEDFYCHEKKFKGPF